jgi:hypothetical protein
VFAVRSPFSNRCEAPRCDNGPTASAIGPSQAIVRLELSQLELQPLEKLRLRLGFCGGSPRKRKK